MNKKQIETFIDFGNYKIRLGFFNNILSEKNYFIEKKTEPISSSKDLNLENLQKIVKETIQEAEKKIDLHIKNLNIMMDIPNFYSIDLSIKKNFEGKYITNEDVQHLIRESRQLIQKNNSDKKIIHMLVRKFIFDKNTIFKMPEKSQKCKNLTLEIKFICYPNNILDKIKNIFKENDILIKNIYCSTYIKSLNYINFFENYEKKIFLDIGFEKTCIAVFDKNMLIQINSIPIGGNHITKDIAQILKLSEENSESIKQSFNEKETTFSEDNLIGAIDLKNNLKKINKDISQDLLIKVVHARVEEIINLSFEKINFKDLISENDYILIFTGGGSKVLNKNAIYLENKYDFISEMKFFEESVDTICRSGQIFNNKSNFNEVNLVSKKIQKKGFFEKLFDLFN